MAAKRTKATSTPTAEASAPVGKNPHAEGSALWAAFENAKRQAKGLPATNNFDGPDTDEARTTRRRLLLEEADSLVGSNQYGRKRRAA